MREFLQVRCDRCAEPVGHHFFALRADLPGCEKDRLWCARCAGIVTFRAFGVLAGVVFLAGAVLGVYLGRM